MSHTNLLYHIVFATKERAPLITDAVRPALHEYLGGITRNLNGTALEINGVADHVHLLILLPPTIAIADFMSKLKANSSSWAKKQTNGRFAWQSRYGAFTVSESQAGRVREYIRTQEEHHRRASFVDEYKALLRAHRIDFDEAHLWT
jgi:REP element-mobilizing transposase RayT